MNRANEARIAPIVAAAKELAVEYRRVTGRPLGITGEVAEFEAVRLLGLQIADVRQSGYDAIGDDGTRYQIKARCLTANAKRNQQVGGIKLDREWDAALLVILDEEFEADSIFRAERQAIETALMAPGSRARNLRGALSVRKFKSIGSLVWSRGSTEPSSPSRDNVTKIRKISQLPELFNSLPKLSAGELDDFERDLNEAREDMNRHPVRDPWAH